jgi:thiol-disulfide isomerase/thioredoxin
MNALRVSAIAIFCAIVAVWTGRKYFVAPPVEPLPAVIEFMPEFTLPDLDDRPRSIDEWSGQPLIINFWATWCAPCRREMPLLQKLHEERGDSGIQVVGVALDNFSDARSFVERIGVTYPILYGEDNAASAAESFGDHFIALPFTASVASGGEILALYSGELDETYLSELVAQMDAIRQGRRTVAAAREKLSSD